ncbi:conserved Plasmodium protein, unknown function [Plasmodium berghei]|uniref:CCAAT-box DNA binding protein subunit B n=2 Tax=Plasmodium berghei TaxID=5821 RepID=A0A509AG88_PLABA|nr:conserved Plasmodium protein, unknown function [Plasmodium berghei ANKA]SCL92887.1 conserved Plasmodium protein, unknown function [Plasmodium berghei]SCM15746.1 conserved Plasmodium protein, unknown function [Plasmodium berghei]SCN22966.1 conserved Plasmodium protein, unknown function [Plasmodium berghei]VUC54523.1 conserved Plasmodium protein, unknown function [Plasmodium berghei ANKA]|eukprot:XP_034420352.1 conserved Plasmodium protein, unknown function [Plasmodium berghei ANKA]
MEIQKMSNKINEDSDKITKTNIKEKYLGPDYCKTYINACKEYNSNDFNNTNLKISQNEINTKIYLTKEIDNDNSLKETIKLCNNISEQNNNNNIENRYFFSVDRNRNRNCNSVHNKSRNKIKEIDKDTLFFIKNDEYRNSLNGENNYCCEEFNIVTQKIYEINNLKNNENENKNKINNNKFNDTNRIYFSNKLVDQIDNTIIKTDNIRQKVHEIYISHFKHPEMYNVTSENNYGDLLDNRNLFTSYYTDWDLELRNTSKIGKIDKVDKIKHMNTLSNLESLTDVKNDSITELSLNMNNKTFQDISNSLQNTKEHTCTYTNMDDFSDQNNTLYIYASDKMKYEQYNNKQKIIEPHNRCKDKLRNHIDNKTIRVDELYNEHYDIKNEKKEIANINNNDSNIIKYKGIPLYLHDVHTFNEISKIRLNMNEDSKKMQNIMNKSENNNIIYNSNKYTEETKNGIKCFKNYDSYYGCSNFMNPQNNTGNKGKNENYINCNNSYIMKDKIDKFYEKEIRNSKNYKFGIISSIKYPKNLDTEQNLGTNNLINENNLYSMQKIYLGKYIGEKQENKIPVHNIVRFKKESNSVISPSSKTCVGIQNNFHFIPTNDVALFKANNMSYYKIKNNSIKKTKSINDKTESINMIKAENTDNYFSSRLKGKISKIVHTNKTSRSYAYSSKDESKYSGINLLKCFKINFEKGKCLHIGNNINVVNNDKQQEFIIKKRVYSKSGEQTEDNRNGNNNNHNNNNSSSSSSNNNMKSNLLESVGTFFHNFRNNSNSPYKETYKNTHFNYELFKKDKTLNDNSRIDKQGNKDKMIRAETNDNSGSGEKKVIQSIEYLNINKSPKNNDVNIYKEIKEKTESSYINNKEEQCKSTKDKLKPNLCEKNNNNFLINENNSKNYNIKENSEKILLTIQWNVKKISLLCSSENNYVVSPEFKTETIINDFFILLNINNKLNFSYNNYIDLLFSYTGFCDIIYSVTCGIYKKKYCFYNYSTFPWFGYNNWGVLKNCINNDSISIKIDIHEIIKKNNNVKDIYINNIISSFKGKENPVYFKTNFNETGKHIINKNIDKKLNIFDQTHKENKLDSEVNSHISTLNNKIILNPSCDTTNYYNSLCSKYIQPSNKKNACTNNKLANMEKKNSPFLPLSDY